MSDDARTIRGQMPHVELAARVLDAAPVIILMLDEQGAIEYANPYFERLTGYRLEEIRGVDWFDTFVPPRDRDRIRALFHASYDGKHVRGNVNAIVTRAGEEREISWTDVMIGDASGQHRGLLAIGHDVTESKAAQDALLASEARLSEAHRMARIGAWRVDLITDAAWWSEEQYRINGFPVGVPVNRASFLNLIHPDDAERWEASRDEMFARGELEIEFRIVTPAGDVRDIHGKAKVTYDALGVPIALAGTNQDITEIKNTERKLEAVVAELQQGDRRKNEFIAMLSHELRNPLSAIQNAIYLLGQMPTTDAVDRTVAVIARQTGQLTRLVDDLLDISRITRGKLQLERGRVDLGKLARTTLGDHESMFEAHRVRLEVAIPHRSVFVDGDAARLTQVIGNLLHNAVKFTPPGGFTKVSLDADPDEAVLRVVDSGSGIDPAMIEQVFEPFAQADRTLARSSGGLGLGLALVKGLVELHGGTVSAHSDGVDRGARFEIRLPLALPAVRAPSTTREPVRRAARRVLVIEDNADVAETLKDLLELEGHEAAVLEDGRMALETALEFEPDIVLCDLGLPVVSGYEVARALRSDKHLQRVKLVALSGYAGPEDLERTRAAGFDQHVAKPIALSTLRQLLEAA